MDKSLIEELHGRSKALLEAAWAALDVVDAHGGEDRRSAGLRYRYFVAAETAAHAEHYTVCALNEVGRSERRYRIYRGMSDNALARYEEEAAQAAAYAADESRLYTVTYQLAYMPRPQTFGAPDVRDNAMWLRRQLVSSIHCMAERRAAELG